MSHGLFLGQLPWAITSGFIRNAAFMGNYSLNPYNFQHFNLCHISLVSKQKLVPNKQEGLAIRRIYGDKLWT